jgi:hypothetical protein
VAQYGCLNFHAKRDGGSKLSLAIKNKWAMGWMLALLKPNRIIRKRTDANCSRPHFGSVGPELCATSSPHVILSMTTPGFGHNEDLYGFWSI